MKTINIMFWILLLVSIVVIGFLISLPLDLLVKGKMNTSTILDLIVLIPATIFAYTHLYMVYKKAGMITKTMIYTVLGYIIIFPIVVAILVMISAVILNG